MVYFVLLPSGLIKIGHTTNLYRRLIGLRYQHGDPVEVLGTLDVERPREREIHRRFAAHRIRRTELFRPAAEIYEFLGLAPPDAGADPPDETATGRALTALISRNVHLSVTTIQQVAFLSRLWGPGTPYSLAQVITEAIDRAFRQEKAESPEEPLKPLDRVKGIARPGRYADRM